MTPPKTSKVKSTRRRQVPRRPFEAQVGVLHRGEYTVERTFFVGEGGLMIGCSRELSEGDLVVVNFKVPTSSLIIVRGAVRSVVAATENEPAKYGLEFQNLEFSAKREIRNFVAAATSYERPAAI